VCVTEKRQSEANRIREKYPDRIPVSFYPPVYSASFVMVTFTQLMSICAMQVIVEKAERSDIPDIDKKKSVLNFSNLP
jgi:GABA(A) receptor-associated protein